jgi:hypothetical protein
MPSRASTWIPIAFGVVIGASFGLHEAQSKSAAYRTADIETIRPARGVAPTKPAAMPASLVQAPALTPPPVVRPSEQHASTPTAQNAGLSATPAKVARAAAPKPKPVHVRPVSTHVSIPKPSDTPGLDELPDARAIFRAESACARKDPEQCLRAARAFRVGVAVRPNPKTASIYWHSALRIYEERCKRREPLSCVGLATMFEKGKGTQPTYAPDLIEHARGICGHRHQTQCDELDAEAERLRALLQTVEAP